MNSLDIDDGVTTDLTIKEPLLIYKNTMRKQQIVIISGM